MKKALALTLAVALLFSVVGMEVAGTTKADPFMPSGSWSDEPTPPSFSVQSPSAKLNYWTGNDVWLDFKVTVPLTDWYSPTSFRYPDHYATTFGNVTQVRFSLDGKPENNANKVSEYEGVLTFSSNLGRLIVGQHIITISAEGSGYFGNLTHDISLASNYSVRDDAKTKLVQSSVSINFAVAGVRPTTPPSISILSPMNKTYFYMSDWNHLSYVKLEYKADDTYLSIGYSLDGDINIIPSVNGTKIDILIQSRRLTLYANDTFGNAATPQTVQYEILPYTEPTSPHRNPPPPSNFAVPWIGPTLSNFDPTSPPEPSPAWPAFAASGALIVITLSIGFWVYFKKIKGKQGLTK